MRKFKHRSQIRLTTATVLTLLTATVFAALAPVLPEFVKSIVEFDSLVGFVFSFSMLFGFVAMLLADRIVEKLEKRAAMAIAFAILIVGLAVFPFVYLLHELLFIYSLIVFAEVLLWVCLGLYIRNTAKRNELGKAEGLYYTVSNLGWLVGPILGGIIFSWLGVKMLFWFCALIVAASLFIFFFKRIKETEKVKARRQGIVEAFSGYFLKKDLVDIYLVSMGVAWWFCLSEIYLPLLMLEMGFGIEVVGAVFALLVLPLILLELPAGRLADRIGCKPFFVIGFGIMMLSALLVYFTAGILWIVLFLVFGYVGAAFVEPLRDTHFFELIPIEEEVSLFAVYKTSLKASFFVAPIFASVVIVFFGLKSVFLLLAAAMVFFLIKSFTIKNRIPARAKA